MIIRGGENIYPTEVENFLHKHPNIEDVQVQKKFSFLRINIFSKNKIYCIYI